MKRYSEYLYITRRYSFINREMRFYFLAFISCLIGIRKIKIIIAFNCKCYICRMHTIIWSCSVKLCPFKFLTVNLKFIRIEMIGSFLNIYRCLTVRIKIFSALFIGFICIHNAYFGVGNIYIEILYEFINISRIIFNNSINFQVTSVEFFS